MRPTWNPAWEDTHPQRLAPLDVERCEVCKAILIDDDGCSWPYCPRGHE